MAIAPTSIKVLVLPAGDSSPRYEIIKTVRTEIKPPASRHRILLAPLFSVGLKKLAAGHMIMTDGDTIPQPNVSLLPDVRERWSDEAWEDRAVLGSREYHILFTQSDDALLELNGPTENSTRGNVLILKLSDTTDEDGRGFYVDLEPDMGEEERQKLARTVRKNKDCWGGRWWHRIDHVVDVSYCPYDRIQHVGGTESLDMVLPIFG